MNAKAKSPTKFKTNTVPAAPVRTAAKSVITAPSKLLAKADVKLIPTRPSAKLSKSSVHPVTKPLPAPASQTIAHSSKQSQLIASLRSTTGVTIEEMMILTGWKAHSLRGVISGALRKRLGLNVVTSPTTKGQSRIYRIVDPVLA